MAQQLSALRASFHQMVVAQQPTQRAANRPTGTWRQQRRAPQPAPLARGPAPLAAVRADQAADTADTASIELISEITGGVDAAHTAALQRNAAAAAEGMAGSASELKQKVRASILDLQNGLLERETEVRLLLLAALCGEHLLLLGPPGTAKSELSRRLSKLTGGRYFERLLTRFSVPEELFGPLSMRGLENDQYVRQIDGYLPTAEVAFIDEIFKANSAILNALLTLLNERLFDNGSERITVPLTCLVGASNELPESEELDALYDRFLIRRNVAQVSAAQLGTLAKLAAGTLEAGDRMSTDEPAGNGAGAGLEELSMEDFRTTMDKAYGAVDVPESVIDLLTGVRNYLQDKCEPPVYVSDRRFMKAVKMLQVAAFADGRSAVHEYDCLLLEFVLGQRPDDAHKVKAFLLETIASDPGLQQTELVFLGLFGRACRVLEAANAQELEEARKEAAALVELLDLRQGSLAATLDGGFPELRDTVWQSEASVQAAVQSLTPQMTENKKRAEDLLREAMLLQAALDKGVPAAVLERLLPKRFKQYQKGISGRA
ncbi:ATPase associated with various cellular activities AAA_5 [Chlorella sorokiniana]|uniref:ATPase associated with various cellular activities AAA_5 n=1 Tax=Chlorella sorokiniana TaxID=3076 RepID=A0A2P6TYX2_CHLSO|nr:ATPase associated with various cellular activities AAA_5 [Chlorella sorokiniana]|eukprot:PRW59240.1 ATPase associated with various cellular activities AAA_5 [Chlorella sorokiniana]